MLFKVENSKMFANLQVALEKAMEVVLDVTEPISTWEMIQEARKQVMQLREEVARYDSDRKNEPKPCINHSKIADRIEEELAAKYQWRYAPRAYAYKIMFIMYLVCKIEPPIRPSWWERKFLERLADYLESTECFSERNCKYSWAIILDQLPGQNRLPLDILPIVPPQQPRFPIIGPVSIYNNCLFTIDQTNHGCQQFYGEVINPTFQDAI